MNRKPTQSRLIILLFFFGFVFSCSEKPPRIAQTFQQLTLVRDLKLDAYYEQLTLFTQIVDEDGNDDVETVYLIHDEKELFWELNAENRQTKEEQGEFWVGSNQIIMNDFSSLPRGEYRLMVIDTAGERDRFELFLSFDNYDPRTMNFPAATIGNNTIRIESGYTQHTLWFYNAAGTLLHTLKSKEKEIPRTRIVARIEKGEEPSYFYCYVYLENEGVGLLSGPYFF